MYPAGQAFITCINSISVHIWYPDSYASKHICNNQQKFADFHPKTYKFITANGDIIWLEQMWIAIPSPEKNLCLTLFNIAYGPECNSKLIFLAQLKKSGILYYNHSKHMILKQEGSTIQSIKSKKNFLVLNIQVPLDEEILTKRKTRPIYLI